MARIGIRQLGQAGRHSMTGPLIVTATFGDADFLWLEELRRRHYPPGRNNVPAHLTLFRQLPPSEVPAVRQRLGEQARLPSPRAEILAVKSIGNGVALTVRSPGLSEIRERLADHFHGLLGPGEQGRWWPHVTVQNKVAVSDANALKLLLEKMTLPRPIRISGLAVWRYMGGPWDMIGRYPFRG